MSSVTRSYYWVSEHYPIEICRGLGEQNLENFRILKKYVRYYVEALDLLTVALSWLLTQNFTVFVAVQQIQHIYYVLNWNKSHMAKRGFHGYS